jgi:hypothetical protein
VAIELGPFGGAEAISAGMVLWALVYAGAAIVAALRGFAGRDL